MPDPRPLNIVLIGYRGCGKSTVGRELAERLGFQHVDTDERIEAESRMTISEIFSAEGERGFRLRENRTVDQVATMNDAVISVGGGAVLLDENVRSLKSNGVFVWLTATAETLFHRISADERSGDSRPPLTHIRGIGEVRKLLAEREPIYRRSADLIVETERQSVRQVVDHIIAWAASRGLGSRQD